MAFLYVGFRFLGLLFAVPVITILWVLKPFLWIKVGGLRYGRIGHLALNTDLFMRRRQLGIYPDGPFYCFFSNPNKVANRQLLNMWKRVIPVYESKVLCWLFYGMLPIFKRTPFYQDLPLAGNEYSVYQDTKPPIYFTPDEIEKGRKLLNKMNVDLDKDEFVCIFSRDNAYLKHLIPENNWDYHDIRNADIDKLIETAKYLIDKGFVVIRMGSIVKKPINFSHKRMIDYPYSGHRNDFMDIFISAHCKFLLSVGGSGINNVANIFERPYLLMGVGNPLDAPAFGENCLYTPKKYKYINSNDYLHFEDAQKMKNLWWCYPADFGLEPEEISSQDILEATQEMLARVEGRFRYSPESERLIQAYHKLWAESNHRYSPCISPITIAWLKKNKDLYF
jgi:putative glycosyltransferase (TIGR04372 family)